MTSIYSSHQCRSGKVGGSVSQVRIRAKVGVSLNDIVNLVLPAETGRLEQPGARRFS